jgi:acyl dehydratase
VVQLRFEEPPPLWRAYARALLSRKPALAASGMPAIEARSSAAADTQALAAYREVCGCPDDGRLPLAYPHILAMPLHMAMLTAPAFPVRLPGLIHVANRIERSRAIAAHERLDFLSTLPGLRETARGQEFDLHTQARSGGEPVWSETCTYLARRPAPREGAARVTPAIQADSVAGQWTAPTDIGRRYARVSGDCNPIHLHAITARLFGYARPIAHGMWSLARVAAQLEKAAGQPLATLDASFKLPVTLPAQLCLHAWEDHGANRCLLADGAGARPHLEGSYTLATPMRT